MGYNKINLLHKIVEVQSIVLEQKKHGASQRWIYDNIIKDKFHISYSTFYNYLSINAKKALKQNAILNDSLS